MLFYFKLILGQTLYQAPYISTLTFILPEPTPNKVKLYALLIHLLHLENRLVFFCQGNDKEAETRHLHAGGGTAANS